MEEEQEVTAGDFGRNIKNQDIAEEKEWLVLEKELTRKKVLS